MDIVLDGRLAYSNGQVTTRVDRGALSFVSSVCVPGAWRFERPVCTDLTAALLATVRREFRPLVMPCGRFVNIGSARVGLFAAGPVPGAAALYLEQDGTRMLFAAGEPSGPASLPACDVLVAAVTSFPPVSAKEALASLVESAASAVRAGMVPVVRCNPAGVAWSVCAALSAAGLRVMAHKGVSRFNRVWRMHGHDAGTGTEFRGRQGAGGVVVLPSHLADSPLEARIEHPWRINVARAGEGAFPGPAPDQIMVLPGALTARTLRELARVVKPAAVHLAGDGAALCAASLASHGLKATIGVVDPVRQFELL